MAEKIFSFGSLEPKYQKLDEEETIESFRMHDFSLKSYSEDFFPEEDFQLAPTPDQPESEPFRWKDFVPYQLKLEESALFPEFYFHFKRSFASISNENRAYCSVDLEKFKSLYVGNEQDIMSSVVRVEQDFDAKFKQCLDPELLKDFSTWVFTRGCVESKFCLTLKERVDFNAYPKRKVELFSKAFAGDVKPLVDFLIAYEYPESAIWHHVFLVYSPHFSEPKRVEIFNEAVEKWQNADVPLFRQIEGFVKDLREAGHMASSGEAAWVAITAPLFICCVILIVLLILK